jgi:hypothetical protein
MKKGSLFACIIATIVCVATGCRDDFPVDEDGLIITGRSECYVSSFNLLGVDMQTVLLTTPSMDNGLVDTVNCFVDATVRFGADLKNLYPQFTLVTDAKLDPKIKGLTDFSDLSHPKQYTVISGNRKIRKTYTVRLAVQQP